MRQKWAGSVRFAACMTPFLMTMAVPYPSSAAANQVKKVYLTFDDGPSLKYTPQILTTLKREHVRGTFFVLGSRVQSFPAIARWTVRDGHQIGNHGYYHEFLRQKDNRWIIGDVRRTDQMVQRTTGRVPKYYRPPGGLITTPEARVVRELGHPIVLWTVDSHDWSAKSSKEVKDNVLRNVRPGAIVLFHDGVSGSRYTALALPFIIHTLKMRGYTFDCLPVR